MKKIILIVGGLIIFGAIFVAFKNRIFFLNTIKPSSSITPTPIASSSAEEEIENKTLWIRGEELSLKSNSIEVIDINGDKKEEIINFSKSASWWNDVYILTPKDDGTFGLFCEHCHFNYNGSSGTIEFVDLNNDGKIEVKISGIEGGEDVSKDTGVYYFIDGDYVKK